MNKTLIAVVGPTAIGKTNLGIQLAQHYQTDIISADSRQFFKEMTIGTAVPSKKELASATHHFIQHISIHDTYTVGTFEKEALDVLNQLFAKKDIVIMVGGSGLYVDAVTKGLDTFPKVDTKIREELNAQLEHNGIEKLQQELKEKDPEYYETVDLNNPHRLIRALEICRGTLQPYSSFVGKNKPKRPFNVVYVGLQADREVVYDRINRRVDIMVKEGLLEETEALYPYKDLNALQTVGYKEIFAHYDGNFTLEDAISEIKKNTRRFAKRQGTWFRKNQEILWFDYQEDIKNVLATVNSKL